jgi:hypothetical protein
MSKPRPRSTAVSLSALDAAQEHCRNVAALARLLAACAASCDAAPVEPQTVSQTGWLLLHEARQLQRSLARLARSGPRRPAKPPRA